MNLHLRSCRVPTVLVLVSLTIAGCGSTVQLRSTAPLGRSELGSAASNGTALPGTQEGLTSVQSSGARAALPQDATGRAQPTGATNVPGSLTQSASAAGAASGGASSKQPIKIGVITQPQLEKTAKTFGLDGVTTGDTKKQVDAVVAWIRTQGGLGGRPIEVYEHAVDMSDANAAQIQNEACTDFSQDHKVQFVVTVLANVQVLASCLAKYGIGLLADNTNFGDKTLKEFAPILADPSEMSPGRMMTTLVDELSNRGWLSPSSKIGILADDGPDGHATVDGPLTAALRGHGLKAATTVFINANSGDGGSSASGSAVLRFRSDGVDKVIPVMYSPLYFMIAAENQGYRPAYAMVSSQGPGALLEGLAPANQLKNAAGIGWAPYLDIGKGKKPPPVTPRATLCLELMRKAGQAATSALVKGFQAQVCDMLFYLKDLADRKPSMPRDILTSGRVALGKNFVSPATYRVDVTNRTDGVSAYRPLSYLDDCQCFQYTGPLRPTS